MINDQWQSNGQWIIYDGGSGCKRPLWHGQYLFTWFKQKNMVVDVVYISCNKNNGHG